MTRLGLTLTAALAAAFLTAAAGAEGAGRTDGPEGSEHGKGGNPFGSPSGRTVLSGSFGTGFFDTGGPRATGFLYGAHLGYEMDDWIVLRGGYSYLSDYEMSIAGLGALFSYPHDRLLFHAGLEASLYAPASGESSFGVAPGIGVDLALNDLVRVGLNYRRDIIFTDVVTTKMDRVYTALTFLF